jgi:hypothetical protein
VENRASKLMKLSVASGRHRLRRGILAGTTTSTGGRRRGPGKPGSRGSAPPWRRSWAGLDQQYRSAGAQQHRAADFHQSPWNQSPPESKARQMRLSSSTTLRQSGRARYSRNRATRADLGVWRFLRASAPGMVFRGAVGDDRAHPLGARIAAQCRHGRRRWCPLRQLPSRPGVE